MPFNYDAQLNYMPVDQKTLDKASATPFTIAGKAMTQLNDAIDNRAFERDISSVKDLQGLSGLTPTTDKQQALMQQKQGYFNALAQQESRALQNQLAQGQLDMLPITQQKMQSDMITSQLGQQEAQRAFDMKTKATKELSQGGTYNPDAFTLQTNKDGSVAEQGVSPTGFNALSNSERISAERQLDPKGQSATFDLMQEQNDLKASSSSLKPSKAQFAVDVSQYEQVIAGGGKLSPSQRVDYKVKKDYIDSEGDVERDIVDNGAKILTKYTGKDLFESNISSDDIASMRTYNNKLDKKTDTKESNELRDSYTVLQASKRITEDLNKIKPEELERGVLDWSGSKLKEWFSDDVFAGLTQEQKRSKLLTATTNTKVGSFLAKYIKSISGTAVAEKEYDRLATVLMGGGQGVNIQTFLQSFKSFGSELNANFKNENNVRFDVDALTSMQLSKRYKDDIGGFFSEQDKEIESNIREVKSLPQNKPTGNNSVVPAFKYDKAGTYKGKAIYKSGDRYLYADGTEVK